MLGRCVIAAALLLPIALSRGMLRPLLPYWKPILAFALIEICLPWLMLGVAEQHLSSSLTGLLIAAVPLVGFMLAWSGGSRLTGVEETLDARRAVGLLVGLAGVGALVGFEVHTDDLWAVVALLVVAVCYAIGPMILTRWLSHLPGLGVITVSLLVTTVIYLPVGLAQAPNEWPSAEAIWSVIGLGVVCTALAFLVFFQLIAEVGPTRATVITYINPAVALLLGVAILDEAFTAATALGFVLILAGSVLATRSAKHRAPVAEPVEHEPAGQEAADHDPIDSTCEALAAEHGSVPDADGRRASVEPALRSAAAA